MKIWVSVCIQGHTQVIYKVRVGFLFLQATTVIVVIDKYSYLSMAKGKCVEQKLGLLASEHQRGGRFF